MKLAEKVFEPNSFNLAEFLAEAEGHRAGVVAEMMKNPVDWCSKPGYKLDAATRTFKNWCYRCKDKNNCESCSRQYKLDKLEILTETMTHFRVNHVVEKIGTEADCKKLRRQHGIEKIIRVPQDDGTVIMLCAVPPAEGDVVLTHKDLTAEYVERLFDTPAGTKVTGGYTRTEEEKNDDDEYVTVRTAIFVIDGTPLDLIKVHKEAIKRTPLTPTAETLQAAIDKHEYAFVEICKEWELEIVKLAKNQKTTIRAKDINWRAPS